MYSFLLGMAALVLALLAIQWFTGANTTAMARNLRQVFGVVAMLAAVLLLLRGLLVQPLALAFVGAWLLGWLGGARLPGGFGGGGQSAGQTSRIVTEHLEMELDHDSGTMTGRILKGMFAGRTIESLKPVEMALLWQDCQFVDPQSAQIVEAYLDRVHPTWREDMARGEREMASGPDGQMGPEEAYEILGLAPGATDEQIRKAHRELMLKLHPDRGGSTYLASKINEAKDVLLKEQS